VAAHDRPDTHEKALGVNLDPKIFGSFAEIGAGQEVARWFLRVGAASGTVAKTISAYDKQVSDDLYGRGTRYVSRQRLEEMLDHEWELLVRQLGGARGGDTRFFVFADTVAARNFAGTNECHGWLGLRFQTRPGGDPHDVVLHVNLRDDANLPQQQALGVLGVNLIHGAFFHRERPGDFLEALFDDLEPGRIEVDLIALRGAELETADPRAGLAELVRAGRAEAVAFPAEGPDVPPTELLHGRPVVLEPGVLDRAEPIRREILDAGIAQLGAELDAGAHPVGLYTVTAAPPAEGAPPPSVAELLRQVDDLRGTGHGVLLFRHRELYHMTALVNRFTRAPIRFVAGVAALAPVFHDRANETLPGTLLEALARLFARNVRLYVHPMSAAAVREHAGPAGASWTDERAGRTLLTADDLRPPAPLGHLYDYLLRTGFIVPLRSGAPGRAPGARPEPPAR
jgi:hypothetical protein